MSESVADVSAAAQTTVLSESESWALLRGGVVGRLAVVVDNQPDIFPVNYSVDHGSIVFATAGGAKLAAALGAPVAFEVDDFDTGSGAAWSVVVKGTVRELTRLHEMVDTIDLPLHPWHAAPKTHYVRIEPVSVTGRQFVRAGGPSASGVRP